MDNKVFDVSVLSELPLNKKGYSIAPSFIVRSNKLTPESRLLYSILLSYCIDKTYCFPTQDTLSESLGYGKDTVRKYLYELEDFNLITIEKVKNKTGTKNIYHINRFEDTLLYSRYNTDDLPDGTNNDTTTQTSIGVGTPTSIGVGTPTSIQAKQSKISKTSISKQRCDALPYSETGKSTNKYLKELEKELEQLNKNTNRSECAKLRIEIADIKNDFKEVTNRDFAYWIKEVIHPQFYKGKTLRTNNYWTSDIKSFIENYNLPGGQVIPTVTKIYEEYIKNPPEQYPRVQQSLFNQYWLIDDLISKEEIEKESKQEEFKQENEEIVEKVIDEGFSEDMEF